MINIVSHETNMVIIIDDPTIIPELNEFKDKTYIYVLM